MRNISELMNLKGRVALITGGAGHFGVAMAHTLAEVGCNLCLVDTNREKLVQVSEELKNKWNVQIEILNMDLENEQARESLPTKIKKTFGCLDILINNAAFVGDKQLQGWVVPLNEQSIDSWRRALEVNLTAVFHLCKMFVPLLGIHGKGSIINIGSIYGVVGPELRLYEGTSMGNPAAYATSKGGIIQLTRWLATVLAPKIRVNCISPGGIYRNQPESFVQKYIDRTPLKRMGIEEDIKGAVIYFSSNLSSYVTGENLMIDGGWTAW